jgi:hypothetical protein
MRDMTLTRGERAIHWIENYCRYPAGYRKGGFAVLSRVERAIIFQIYDAPNGPQDVPVTGPLAAYLALLHTAGPEGKQKDFRPTTNADIFTMWNATSADLRRVLKRKGESIVCAGLGTSYSPRAA